MLSTQAIRWCIENCAGYVYGDEAKKELSDIRDYIEKLEAAQHSVQRTGCTGDHDIMLYAGIETCTVCGHSTRPARR